MANITANDGNYTRSAWPIHGLDVFLVSLNIFLSITASLSNALILIALHKVTSIYPPTKLLFRCLAFTDLGVGLISQPLFVVLLPLITDLDINWDVMYHFYWASVVVLATVSILSSTAISVDRLLALMLRLRYRQVVSLSRVRALIICVWMLSCALAAGIAFGENKISYITENLLLVLIILCTLTSIISYTKIYLRLRHHQIQLQANQQQRGQPLPNRGEIPLNIARYKKTVSSIAWVQLAILICYLPFPVSIMLQFHGALNLGRASEIPLYFFFLNSSLNPILYCWKIIDVRQAVKDTIKCHCCKSS